MGIISHIDYKPKEGMLYGAEQKLITLKEAKEIINKKYLNKTYKVYQMGKYDVNITFGYDDNLPGNGEYCKWSLYIQIRQNKN